MVRLLEIPRTATFAWSPGTRSPLLATGTKAGAVDEGFSNETQLELWDPDLDNFQRGRESKPAASVNSDSRFNDIAWVTEDGNWSRGIIAGALENGSLDLWDADKLLSGDKDALKLRTSKHSGAIKALQFNAFRSELLATVGAKGELFISDLNNIGNPFRMGNAVARADDFDCLDWNKRTAHILATGSSGGTMTVWDVKNKRESLTLNNLGRKPVSAIAWDPVKTTRLITAVPNDTDPVILVWDLRNANAPERLLQGHDRGVLSLSWCSQDGDLLLSSGKDNRNICWNPQTGDLYGEFPVVTNWTFQTRWNSHHPDLVATASFDGKIAIQSIQSTKHEAQGLASSNSQTEDDDDFFNKSQSAAQGTSFNLQKAPKWLQRPCGASFGFGGKVVVFKGVVSETSKRSIVRISTFSVDASIVSSTQAFETALKENDINSICENRICGAKSNAEKADWKIIKTLTSKSPRKDLVYYLGYSNQDDEAADGVSKLSMSGSKDEELEGNLQPPASKSNRLSAFFDNSADGDSFLSELAATKGAKTNNPFQLYTGSESESDRRITRALLLGEFDKALDVCLQDDMLSDAFMIAICGGQQCIEKAQKAYFNRKAGCPNYLRLLASVVGQNLWDLVHNADLSSWKDIMATICTYADAKEFPDLCEVLGDRLDEQMKIEGGDSNLRKDALFCYLAGSKLEKVVSIWIAELEESEGTGLQGTSKESFFTVHARSLQDFIEKVTIFRKVIQYQDSDVAATSEWRLASLYDKYIEYADIASAHGQLQIAEKYLELLPRSYPAAEVSKSRVKQAARKVAATSASKQSSNHSRVLQGVPQSDFQQQQQQPQPPGNSRQTATSGKAYTPAVSVQTQNRYGPVESAPGYNSVAEYQSGQSTAAAAAPNFLSYQKQPLGPPPRNLNTSPTVPTPSKTSNMSNWNDTPESFFKPPTSRRGTPGAGAIASTTYQPALQPNNGQSFGTLPRSTPPIGPPPKGPAAPVLGMSSLSASVAPSPSQPERPSSAANTYAPPAVNSESLVHQQSIIPRGISPYNAPPSAPPPSNRYAPSQPTQPAAQISPIMHRGSRQEPPPANPYAPQQNYNTPLTRTSQPPPPPNGPSPGSTAALSEPPQAPSQVSPSGTAQSLRKPAPLPPKYPPGDRNHIPSNAQPIYEIFHHEMQRVKSRAPSSFRTQVNDTEKRLNILFDHLNNEDLLKTDTIASMAELAQAVQARDFQQAQVIHVEILTNKTDECGNWMVGVKRLIAMSRATP